MILFFTALAILLGSGLASLLAGRSRAGNVVGPAGIVLACLVGLCFAASRLAEGGVVTTRVAWDLPLGRVGFAVDGLSAFFMAPTFLLGALTVISGRGALAHRGGAKSLGAHWFFFALMIAAQVTVLAASNGVLFLGAWEVMSVAPFILISFNDDQPEVRAAAWTYLLAAHFGLVFISGAVLLLAGNAGSFSFAALAGAAPSGRIAGAAFLLGLAGFGIKAGLVPLHVWLPEAHPVAPSHVSAYLSGSLIKAGIYGLVRLLSFSGQPQPWQAYLLVGLGLGTALLGIIQAMGKRHLKRLLAYSSVENIGLITLGLGLYWLGRVNGRADLAVLGLAGALLHVWAHCLAKGSLFLAAGAVLHSTGTVVMNRLGGLLKSMPVTGAAFGLCAAAICGLPPLACFASEILLYFAAGRMGLVLGGTGALAAWLALAGMALTGGLAGIVFSKAFGGTFLGEPRSGDAQQAHDPSPAGWAPFAALALGSLALGLAAPLAAGPLSLATSAGGGQETAAGLEQARAILVMVSLAGWALLGLCVLLGLTRLWLLRGKPRGEAATWDCGYGVPTARMQYTPSSFSEPLTHLLGGLTGASSRLEMPKAYFPARASYAEATPDVVRERGLTPFFLAVNWLAEHLKWLQHGNLNLYILYIALTLTALLGYNLLTP